MPTLVFDRNDEAAAADAAAAPAGLVGRLLTAFARWRLRRATYRELMALDDRQLADIGLRRGSNGGIDGAAFLGDFEYGWTLRPRAANANHPSRAA
jgi:uncharacterized protein YjiS (DUF1127 family)